MKTLKFVLPIVTFGLIQLLSPERAAGQSGNNLYRVFVSAVSVTTNDSGRLVPFWIDNRDIVRKCAADNGVSDPRTLTLVYDVEADALEVVDRSTGDLICTPYTFSEDFSLTSPSGATRERLAFVFAESSDTAGGSLKATERRSFDSEGNIVRFNLSGRFQFAVAPDNGRSKIVSGNLFTGRRFAPGTR
jgi:hypothetical protein